MTVKETMIEKIEIAVNEKILKLTNERAIPLHLYHVSPWLIRTVIETYLSEIGEEIEVE